MSDNIGDANAMSLLRRGVIRHVYRRSRSDEWVAVVSDHVYARHVDPAVAIQNAAEKQEQFSRQAECVKDGPVTSGSCPAMRCSVCGDVTWCLVYYKSGSMCPACSELMAHEYINGKAANP